MHAQLGILKLQQKLQQGVFSQFSEIQRRVYLHEHIKCSAGPQAEETPCRFQADGQRRGVEEVLERWEQLEGLPEWPRASHFNERAARDRDCLLEHDREADVWFLVRPW